MRGSSLDRVVSLAWELLHDKGLDPSTPPPASVQDLENLNNLPWAIFPLGSEVIPAKGHQDRNIPCWCDG